MGAVLQVGHGVIFCHVQQSLVVAGEVVKVGIGGVVLIECPGRLCQMGSHDDGHRGVSLVTATLLGLCNLLHRAVGQGEVVGSLHDVGQCAKTVTRLGEVVGDILHDFVILTEDANLEVGAEVHHVPVAHVVLRRATVRGAVELQELVVLIAEDILHPVLVLGKLRLAPP